MHIESKQVSIAASPVEVFEYLSDLNHFRELLPQDKISEWQSDAAQCSFKVAGAYTIGLRIKESFPHRELHLVSAENGPLPFDLRILIEPTDEGTSARQIVDAKVNPFVKMMVEKPLANLFDHIADKLVLRFA